MHYILLLQLRAGSKLAKPKLSISSISSKEVDESKRPPWRSVANPTPIKVNKNALLKAKILDATRRALLAQRINHISTQTDQPYSTTMLMRDQETDIQKDLIGLEDKSMETDGAVTLRQECPGGFIITQTIGQMTDLITSKEIATQTPLPKVNLSFALLNKHIRPVPQKPKRSLDEKMYMNEQLLQSQMTTLRKIDDNLRRKLSDDAYVMTDMAEMASIIDEQQYYDRVDDSKYDHYDQNDGVDFETASYNQYMENMESTDEDSKDEAMSANASGECLQQMREPKTVKNNSLVIRLYARINVYVCFQRIIDPTLTSWEDFELTDEENDLPDLPRKSMSEGSTPWNNFKELVIGQR